MKKKILNWFILSLFITLIASCGPVTKAYIRSTFDEVEKGQNRVSKNDVTITAKALVGDLKDSVPSFFVSYTGKDQSGNVENKRSNIFLFNDLIVFEAQILRIPVKSTSDSGNLPTSDSGVYPTTISGICRPPVPELIDHSSEQSESYSLAIYNS